MVNYGQVLLEAQGNAGYSVSILFLLFLGISLGWEVLVALLTLAAETLGGGGAGTRLWLLRLKEELLSLGVISLVLAFIKNPLTRICIPTSLTSSVESAQKQVGLAVSEMTAMGITRVENFNKVAGRRLLGHTFEEAPWWQQPQPLWDPATSHSSWPEQLLDSLFRFVGNLLNAASGPHQDTHATRLAWGSSNDVGPGATGQVLDDGPPPRYTSTGRSLFAEEYAPDGPWEASQEETHTCPEDKTLLFTKQVVNAAHYLLFYLAIVQILYSLLSMGFSIRRFRQLREWERAARAEPVDIPDLLGRELLTRHSRAMAKKLSRRSQVPRGRQGRLASTTAVAAGVADPSSVATRSGNGLTTLSEQMSLEAAGSLEHSNSLPRPTFAQSARVKSRQCAGGFFDCASTLWVGFWGNISLPTFDALRATLQLRSRAQLLHEMRHVNFVNAAEQALQHELYRAHAHAWVQTLLLAILLLFPLHAYQLIWVSGVSPVLLLILTMKMASMLRKLPPMLDKFEEQHGLPINRPLTAAAAAASAAAATAEISRPARKVLQSAARTAASSAVSPVPLQALRPPAAGGYHPPTPVAAAPAPPPSTPGQMEAGQRVQSFSQGLPLSSASGTGGAGGTPSLGTPSTSPKNQQEPRIQPEEESHFGHGEELHEPVAAAAVAAAAAAATDPDSAWQLKKEHVEHVEDLDEDLDRLFWFGWPALMLWMIVIVSTINALSITVSVYFLLSTGPSTGIHAIFLWLVLLFIDILTAIYLGYVVQPQYALLSTGLHHTPDKLHRILQAMNRDDDEEEGGITGLVLKCFGYFHPHKRLAAQHHRTKHKRRRRHASAGKPLPHVQEHETGQHDGGGGDSDATAVNIVSALQEQQKGPGDGQYNKDGDDAVQSSGPSTATATTTAGTPSVRDKQEAALHALYPAGASDYAQPGAVTGWDTHRLPGSFPAHVAGPGEQGGAGGASPGAGPGGGETGVAPGTLPAGPAALARVGHAQGMEDRGSHIDDVFVALLAQRAGVMASRGPTAAGASAAAHAFHSTLLHYAPVFTALARYWAAKARAAAAGHTTEEHLKMVADAEEALLSTREMAPLRTAFMTLDVDHSGAVSMSELAEHVRHVLGTRATEGELAAMLDEGGAGGGGGKGLITFKGFLLTCAFAAFDVSGAGRVTAASLAASLSQMGAPDVLFHVPDMISYADPDQDGQVGLRQFLRIFEDLPLENQQPKTEEGAAPGAEGQSQVAASILRFFGRKSEPKKAEEQQQ